MDIIIRGRHMDVSAKFRELAKEKVSRMERFGIDIARIDVEVSKEQNPRLADRAIEVELTCHGRGNPIRAEVNAADQFTALDMACDTLTERLRRLADKRTSRRRRHARAVPSSVPLDSLNLGDAATPPTEAEEDVPEDVVYADGPVVVRQKTHNTTPMTVSEALDALEMVGHEFYFFFDSETSQASVVYRRRGYDYGLIRLDIVGED
jgi:ribosomal subunit interface protein